MSTHDERLRTYWLQALVSAARATTSPAVRRAHAQAVATVAKSAPEPRAAKLVADAVQLYSDPGVRSCCTCLNVHSIALLILPGVITLGGRCVPHPVTLSAAGDAGSRLLSGLLLRELVRGAPDTFAAHASAVLPCAFVACHDDDSEVAGVWKDVWEEGTGSPAAATRLHISEITGIIQTGAATICIALP